MAYHVDNTLGEISACTGGGHEDTSVYPKDHMKHQGEGTLHLSGEDILHVLYCHGISWIIIIEQKPFIPNGIGHRI